MTPDEIEALLAELGADREKFWESRAGAPTVPGGSYLTSLVEEGLRAIGVPSIGACMGYGRGCGHPAFVRRGKARWCLRCAGERATEREPRPPLRPISPEAKAASNAWIRDYDKPLPVEWSDPKNPRRGK